jgi:GNAT superfamily N-acetyltransferase
MVRKAKEEDYQSIITLRESYILDREQLHNPDYLSRIQKEGFLIRSYSKTDFLSDLNNTFLVHEEDGKLIAYLRIENSIDSDFQYDRLNVWMNNDYKDIYFNESNHAEIGAIGVAKEYLNTDVLKDLLDSAIEQLKVNGCKYLFSSVVYAPIVNMYALFLYEECGFEKVCLTTSANMNDMVDYQGLLYVKAL